jgi:hypothetical protein
VVGGLRVGRLGRVDEARQRADVLCAALPCLLPEEVEPFSREGRGNVPLVWSHIEVARAMYLLDAARLRERYGAVGLGLWRVGRYAWMTWCVRTPPKA